MKKKLLTLVNILACCSFSLSAQVASAEDKPDKLSVAYFLEWPTANQAAQVDKIYDKELGVEVEWLPFESGTAMSAAMASGDVDIAYSQGLVPFVVAVSQGLPITTVGVAVSYSENDNCIVYKDAGITKANAKDLAGKRVAVPFGTVSHYKMLKVLEHLEVDSTTIQLLDMVPSDGAAALSRGAVSMACGWGGALRRMKEYGSELMSASEQDAIGISAFDVISVTNSFAEEYPELLTQFLKVTDDSYRTYKETPEAVQATIAKAAGMELTASNETLALFQFPLKDEQISDAWLGKTIPEFTQQVADFFAAQNQIPKALDDYSHTIDASFYEKLN